MEYLRKLIWNNYSRDELGQIIIEELDREVRMRVLKRWDAIAKPLDSLGSFEGLIARIGGIQGSEQPALSPAAVIVMCADNGIVEEGVTQSGQEVTLQVAKSMGERSSSVCRMAKKLGCQVIPVDIGIHDGQNLGGVKDCKIRKGTRNFSKEPAMTDKEAIQAIAVGIEAAREAALQGCRILATGEMGIGNTTTSSAIASVLLDCEPEQVTGRGAGLDDRGLQRKKQVIREAIEKYSLRTADPLTVLRTVGGLDIAGLAGVCIGGAIYHVPIVLDGVISMVAGLVAERLFPGVREYLIPSHKGKEPAVVLLSRALGLEPVIDAGLALGEGTGAVMMLSLLELAGTIYNTGNGFGDISVEPYKRFH